MFVGAVSVLFEAAGQPVPLPRPSLPLASVAAVKDYRAIDVQDADIQTALRVALRDQKAKNRAAVKLLTVLTAEHQSAATENYRLCLSLDRRGRIDTARVVVQQTSKKKWSVALWAWGACGPQAR